MNLDRIAVVLRARGGAQAIDLGMLLGRRFYGPIFKVWLVMVVPLLLVVQWGAYGLTELIWVAVVVGWWVKPLFDRIPLYVVSRGFFGSTPTVKESVKAVWGQWWSVEAVKDLTYRRFSPMRPLTLPVRVLEGQKGKAVGRRLDGLYDGGAVTESMGLLGLIGFVKVLYYVGAMALILMVMENELSEDFYMVEVIRTASELPLMGGAFLVSLVVTTLVEPFVGACGFGMYIQRRIEREGWDLELKFRRLAERIQGGVEKVGLIASGVLAALMVMMAGPAMEATAQEFAVETGGTQASESSEGKEAVERAGVGKGIRENRRGMPGEPEEVLGEVLERPEFETGERTVTRWRAKVEEEDAQQLPDVNEGLMAVLQVFAAAGRVLLWVLFVGLLGFVGYRVWLYLEKGRGQGGDAGRVLTRWEEEILSQSDGDLEVLDDVVQAAREAWRRGRRRHGLALLLLGSLRRFEEENRFRFLDGWTTARCAREVRGRGVQGETVARIAKAFDELAWAKRQISEERFEGLCVAYGSAFVRVEDGHE